MLDEEVESLGEKMRGVETALGASRSVERALGGEAEAASSKEEELVKQMMALKQTRDACTSCRILHDVHASRVCLNASIHDGTPRAACKRWKHIGSDVETGRAIRCGGKA